ncbi:SH3, type 3 domain protein, partial [Candidatus Magnetomorum sp. HK-1]
YKYSETIYVKECLKTCKGANIRENATEYSNVSGTLKAGESVIKLNQNNGWYYIESESGITGWVHKTLLMHEEPLSNIISKLKTNNAAMKNNVDKLKKNNGLLNTKIEQLNSKLLHCEKELKTSRQKNEKIQVKIEKFSLLQKELQSSKSNYEQTFLLLKQCQKNKDILNKVLMIFFIILLGCGIYIYRLQKDKQRFHL